MSTGVLEAGECDAAGGDAVWLTVWLSVGDGDVLVVAVLIPTLHAARDRPAAQVVTLAAMRRYTFIECLSVSLVGCQFKARRPPCHGSRGDVAILRQRA
jgi:hypothetical protein